MAFCPKCGSQNPDYAAQCQTCGTMLATTSNGVGAPSQAGKGLAIAGMVCGIVSFFCFPYILGLLGIIFGAVARNKGYRGGMATAGIACGVIGIALWLVMIIWCSGMGLLTL